MNTSQYITLVMIDLGVEAALMPVHMITCWAGATQLFCPGAIAGAGNCNGLQTTLKESTSLLNFIKKLKNYFLFSYKQDLVPFV